MAIHETKIINVKKHLQYSVAESIIYLNNSILNQSQYKINDSKQRGSTLPNPKVERAMSQDKVLKTLESLGFTHPYAQVYIFLGKRGPKKAKDIAKALRMPKQQLYSILKNLQSKGIVNVTLEHPARFSAVQFEKVLDLFVSERMEEAYRIQQGKKEFLIDWQSISIVEASDNSPKFTVIEGRNYIYPRLKQMIKETKDQLMLVSTLAGLIHADQFGLLDAAFYMPLPSFR